MVRHLTANGMTLLIVALVAALGVLGWGLDAWRAPGPLAEARVVEIPSGSSLERIGALLREAGVVRSATVFRIGVRYAGAAGDLKSGVYEVPAGATMAEVAALLRRGGAQARYRVTYGLRADAVTRRVLDLLKPEGARDVPAAEAEAVLAAALAARSSVDYRVTVPEGLTSFQVVEGLRRIAELQGEVAEVPAEGSLAPDTYSFAREAQRQALVDQMAAAQRRVLAAAWERRREGLPIRSAEEALILASLIEKETGIAEERPVVASVFVNRLREGMRLETDPAVIYGITLGREVFGRELTRADLEKRTPYNTYRIDRLPPTPIANPGRAAIEAALNPADTRYRFFVADGTGGHAFAETKGEHDANVRRWREIERQREAERAARPAPSQP